MTDIITAYLTLESDYSSAKECCVGKDPWCERHAVEEGARGKGWGILLAANLNIRRCAFADSSYIYANDEDVVPSLSNTVNNQGWKINQDE